MTASRPSLLRLVSADGATSPALDASSQTTAVLAQGNVALDARGAVKFQSAGLATIARGKSSVTVVPPAAVDITASTKVLVTPQSGGGTVRRVGRNPTADTFRIVLTRAATQTMTVAHFVIS